MLQIYENRQWGTFESLQSVKQKIKKIYQHDVTQNDIDEAAKILISTNFLESRKSKQLIKYSEFLNLIESFVFMNTLLKEIKNKNYSLVTKFAKLRKIAIETLVKSFILSVSPKSDLDINKIIEGKLESYLNSLPDYYPLTLLKTADDKFFLSRSEIIDILARDFNLFQMLNAFPPIDHKSNTKVAYEILEIEVKTKDEDIKKQYRKIVKERHPDVMSAKGIDDKYTALITENFAKIQIAYDIIKKDRNL